MGVGLLWQLLSKGQLDRHGCFFDAENLTVNPLLIDPEAWKWMGYTPPSEKAA
jgi:hypothetical protein